MLKSIIDALAHGRLVELPGNDKGDALQFLATMLEAVPSIPPGTDIVEVVLEHEKVSNTSLGGGWACPHARVRFDGELSCAIGWSPAGIDYGVPGEPPVHMIVMYLVPDNQRNAYLKEVSSLARVLQNNPRYLTIEAFTSLDTSRNNLLDIAHLAMNGDGKNPRARMIQLATQSKAAAPEGRSGDRRAADRHRSGDEPRGADPEPGTRDACRKRQRPRCGHRRREPIPDEGLAGGPQVFDGLFRRPLHPRLHRRETPDREALSRMRPEPVRG